MNTVGSHNTGERELEFRLGCPLLVATHAKERVSVSTGLSAVATLVVTNVRERERESLGWVVCCW